jgi:hypothetical protein
MGQVNAERKDRVAALVAAGKQGKKDAAKLESRARRAQSMHAMGIFEPKDADAFAVAFASGIDPHRAVAAMRWDTFNPWGTVLEKFSSHPLVAHRIAALEESGLPGAPKAWSVLRSSVAASPAEKAALRVTFARELGLTVAPWVVLALMLLFGAFTGSALSIGAALVVAGVLLFLKQQMRYPTAFEPVDEITSLLERMDASPVKGIPVRLSGEVMGRGMPGYVLSPDLVIHDETGFVVLQYRQPIPFARAWFGLFRAKSWMGQTVIARGWYRRMPGPMIELRDVTADGKRARTWEWVARYAGSCLVFAAGLIVLFASIA